MTSYIRHLTALICLAALGSTQAAPADRFAGVEITAQHVRGSVHMLEGAGGNIGVSVGPDGTLIIDDQFAPLGEKILAALDKLGGNAPKLILNTHFHGDHTGSNPLMGETGTIISHDNVRIRLTGQEGFPRSGLPLVTYDDDLTVHFNDDQLSVIHLPSGHTDGDSVIWFRSANVIHMGDHYFKGRFPFVDVGSGGSVDGFIANVLRVIAMLPEDVLIIPGHGSLSTLAEMQQTIEAVSASAAMIRQGLAAGSEVAEIAARVDAEYPGWGSGFINAERWVQIVQADADQ